MEKQCAKYVLFMFMKYVGIRIIIAKHDIISKEATLKINMPEPAWAVIDYRKSTLVTTIGVRNGLGPLTPYEGLNLANQEGRKLGIFGRKLEGSYFLFYC